MKAFTMQEGGFTVADYVVFGILCIGSCSGGLWYSAIGSKRKAIKDVNDYLLGGKAMSTFPVAMSLIASYVSGVTIMGTPAEIYNYGSQYWLVVVGVSLSCVVVCIIYLPVFCTLMLSSSYEYLELRFNKKVRGIASILFLFDEILFLPMVVFVPALAFNQLTGANVFVVGGIMVLICGLYTVLGGLKAVVWTDSVQTGVMFLGVVIVVIVGTFAVGGVTEAYNIASISGRMDLSNWNFSPLERQTGWGSVIGGCIYWSCFNSVNQTMVQRYIALNSKKKAISAISIFCVGAVLSISLCAWLGVIAYVAWVTSGCDEGATPLVDDRMLPSFVTYIAETQNIPGLSGIFLAGVFGAGLSSLSAVLNACALVIVEDIMHGCLQMRCNPLHEGLLARGATAVLAVLSVVMLLVIRKLGGVLGVATGLSAIAASTTCGVFTLGMLCTWVGPRGAVAGALGGAITASFVSMGSQVAAARGLRTPPMNFTMQCPNEYANIDMNLDPTSVFPLFRISYLWVAPIGLVTTLIVGSVMGWLLDKKENIKMDAELFSPVVWHLLPARAHEGAGTTRRERQIAQAAAPIAAPLIIATVEKIEMNGELSR